MDVHLPEDILHMISGELERRKDFATLYNCAVSCKQWAPLALSSLYRMHTDVGSDEDETAGLHRGAQEAIMKWSIVWRSIVLLAMDKTLYPYCKYLRVLDLRDLRSLLDDSKFAADKISKVFFGRPLSGLHFTKEVTGVRSGTRTVLDVSRTLEAIGDAVTPEVSMVEALAGEFSSAAFLRWLPHLTRLQRLELFDGTPFVDDEAHHALYKHCPGFDSLSLYRWSSSLADLQLGKFIQGVKAESLKSLVTICECGVSKNTCRALSSHGNSLHELNLYFSPNTIDAVTLLKDCTAIEKLQLKLHPHIDLEVAHKDVLVELADWLQTCGNLRSITVHEMRPAPTVLTPLLQRHSHLHEVFVTGTKNPYIMKSAEAKTFHQALAKQKNLNSLSLSGGEGCAKHNEGEHDIDVLVSSLGELKHLHRLDIRGVSDYFEEDHIATVLLSCPKLEEVYVAGNTVTDAVLPAVAAPKSLRRMNFTGESEFTAKGLLGLISELGPGNAGLDLAITNAFDDSLIPEEELAQVRKALYEKVGGRLDYEAIPAEDEYEGDSD